MERGYLFFRIDGRKIAFHRWVMEQILGRRLSSEEVVHHVDGDKLNNDPANVVLPLKIRGRSAGSGTACRIREQSRLGWVSPCSPRA